MKYRHTPIISARFLVLGLLLASPVSAQIVASPPAPAITVKPQPDPPPSVTITASCRQTQPFGKPLDCYAPATIDLTATVANIPPNYVVRFRNGPAILMTLSTPPYIWVWTEVPEGAYSALRATLEPATSAGNETPPYPTEPPVQDGDTVGLAWSRAHGGQSWCEGMDVNPWCLSPILVP